MTQPRALDVQIYAILFSNVMMRKHLLLLLTIIFCATSAFGQCLGEDCSIKGRNKAAKKKAVQMTGNKKLGKIRKIKRNGVAFDPFASSGKKGKGMGGFDPFEAEANKKKAAKKGRAFDPFTASNSGKKFKGNRGGYDPFEASSRKSSKSKSGGFDPFTASSRKSVKIKGGNNSWVSNTRSLSVETGGFAGWDGGRNSKIKNRRGKANDTWASNASRKGVSKGGGVWANSTSKHASPASGKKKKAGYLSSNNWDQVMMASAPSDASDATRSWDQFGGSRISGDISYSKPHQFKFSVLAGSILKTGSTTKQYLKAIDPSPAVLGGEFAIEWPTTGGKNYHHYFNIPTIGLAASYMYLGDNDDLGHVAAVYPYVNIPFVRSAPVDFYFIGGIGLAYVSDWDHSDWKDYQNGKDNFSNPLTGAPVNAFFKTGLGLAWRPVTKASDYRSDKQSHYTITAEAGLIHLCDAGFAQPDKGINVITGQIGLKYNPDDNEVVIRGKAEHLAHRFTIDISASGGARELTHLDDTKYAVANANLGLYFQAADVYRIGVGVDGFFDNSFSVNHIDCNHNKYSGKYDHKDFADQIRAGVCLSNEIVFGRVTTALDGGYYFVNPIDVDNEKFYFRLGLKYRFTRNWFALINMKTHGWAADCATLGLGYSIQL